ncbi:OLC1v1018299C1 [Oldenlandia corymbosa var. corymbosa]|uniref:OLC1v1018299C1 n=1 Tax=Oldenlandia corymbosa var. corymbosa TaxID=529605 RepID=A0AAV1EB98_OLDCO|nr:OLC1v1018299C1 [Oldenlandia corymbosa var. corymbosa]
MRTSNVNFPTSYFLCYCFLFFSSVSWRNIWAESGSQEERFLQCLHDYHQSNTKLVFTPNDSSYNSIFLSSVQNLRLRSPLEQKPLVIVTPINYLQVQSVVTCAKVNKMRVRTRGGGHDYEGLSSISYYKNSPFVLIDLKKLRSISINTKAKTAWVEGGGTLGQLYYKISQKSQNLGFPAGLCPTVGVGGHLSAGGEGTLSRKYGIAADHIIDAKVVNANGEILDRKSMREDLFWAIRGGGGASFGVILAYKISLVHVPSVVTVFTVNKTLEQNATKLVHLWQTIAPKLNRDLFIRIRVDPGTTKNGKTTVEIKFNSIFLGRADKLLLVMKESFPELGLKRSDCKEMTWIESALYFSDLPSGSTVKDLARTTPYPNDYYKAKSDYVIEPIPEAAFEGLWKRFMASPAPRPQLIFAPYGGRMAEISESEIPFPHRAGNLFQIQYLVSWDAEENADSHNHIDWIREAYEYMASFVSKSPRLAYYNYRDLDLGFNEEENISFEDSAWGFKYFKNNFYRLARDKAAVDPTNFFRYELSIPPLES